MRIALLEDDDLLAEMVCLWIEILGHQCTRFCDGRQLTNCLKGDSFDMLVLDWIVQGMNGEEGLIWVRKNVNWSIPVIFMTQRDDEDDIVKNPQSRRGRLCHQTRPGEGDDGAHYFAGATRKPAG